MTLTKWRGSTAPHKRSKLYKKISEMPPGDVLEVDHPERECNRWERRTQCTLHHAIWIAAPRWKNYTVAVHHIPGLEVMWILRLPR